jgi:hypothetical protein
MPPYDSTFSPPAPVADVVVAHPVRGLRRRTLRGKMDCGADTTVIGDTRSAHCGRARACLR